MPRTIWTKVLVLHCSPLVEAHAAGRTQGLAGLMPNFPANPAAPVALRWAMNPFYGLPRQVFTVYRRLRRATDLQMYGQDLAVANTALTDAAPVEWGNVEYALLAVRIKPAVGKTVGVTAIDSEDQPIPGQTVTLAQEGWAVFQAPGVAALRTVGAGTLVSARGISLAQMANLADWGPAIQKVGMPWQATEIAAPAYQIEGQGFGANPSWTGDVFAQHRLQMAAAVHLSCPLIPGKSGPVWGPTNPAALLAQLRADVGGYGLLHSIRQC